MFDSFDADSQISVFTDSTYIDTLFQARSADYCKDRDSRALAADSPTYLTTV